MAGEFTKAFKNIAKGISTSTNQALKRAGSSTKAKFVKDISEELGITGKRAKSRAFLNTKKAKNVSLDIGVKFPFNAHDFKPKAVNVQTAHGKRKGAAYTVKGQGTVVTDKGFIIKGKSSGKTLIMERKADSRYPIASVKVEVFRATVEGMKEDLQDHMVETFEKNLLANIKYNLGK